MITLYMDNIRNASGRQKLPGREGWEDVCVSWEITRIGLTPSLKKFANSNINNEAVDGFGDNFTHIRMV